MKLKIYLNFCTNKQGKLVNFSTILWDLRNEIDISPMLKSQKYTAFRAVYVVKNNEIWQSNREML